MTATLIAPTAAPPRSRGPLTGTPTLVRFALRRDRVRLPSWVGGIVATLLASAAGFPGIYPDQAAIDLRAELMSSPAAVAMGGPRIGLDHYGFGAMMTNEMLGLTAVVVALMSVFTVVRHSRADEEAGRTELVRGSAVGRSAPLAAALVVTAGADLALGLLTAVGMASLGVDGIDWPGSLLYGAALSATGLVFAGVAAVTAQITQHGRTASSLAGLALGVAYGVRAVGDVLESPLSWLSPIAWAQRTYAYVDNQWWPIGLSLVVAAALVGLAWRLSSRRDFGAGLRQPRPGPAQASPLLSTPLALAARLSRTAVVAWAVSLLAFGLVYGTLLGQVDEFASEMAVVNDVLGRMHSDVLVDSFLALIVNLLAMTTAIFGITAVLRARSEEAAGLAEAVLATPVSRARWLGSHVTVAAAGSLVIVLAAALGFGASAAASLMDASQLPAILGAALVQSVPVLFVVGLAAALYGWLPRLAPAVWAVLGYGLFVGTFAGLLGLPDWTLDLSPFSMVPLLPAESWSTLPVVGMLLAAGALVWFGMVGLARRDMAAA